MHYYKLEKKKRRREKENEWRLLAIHIIPTVRIGSASQAVSRSLTFAAHLFGVTVALNRKSGIFLVRVILFLKKITLFKKFVHFIFVVDSRRMSDTINKTKREGSGNNA